MFKYCDVDAASVHFIDCSSESITEAVRRHRLAGDTITYHATFSIADCFSDELRQVLVGTYDLVVCHFALHYAFSDAARVSTFMQTLSDFTHRGSSFLMTFPRYATLRHYAHPFHNGYWQSFSGKHFAVTFPVPLHDSASREFGAAYSFSLDDAVDSCTEYLVPPELLHDQLTAHNFRTVSMYGFDAAAEHLNILNDVPYDEDLRTIVNLYAVCVAVRTDDAGVDTPADHTVALERYCRLRGLNRPRYREFPTRDYRGWTAQVRLEQRDFVLEERSSVHSTKRMARHHAAERLLHALESPGIVIVEDVSETLPSDPADPVASDSLSDIDTLRTKNCTEETAKTIVYVDDAFASSLITPTLIAQYSSTCFFRLYCPSRDRADELNANLDLNTTLNADVFDVSSDNDNGTTHDEQSVACVWKRMIDDVHVSKRFRPPATKHILVWPRAPVGFEIVEEPFVTSITALCDVKACLKRKG